MLHQKIREEIKQAMLEKNPVKLNAIRGLLAACTNELVSLKRKPNELLTDEEVAVVAKRSAKQRQEAIDQFRKGNRNDLAEQESIELTFIKNYLPPEMSSEEITEAVREEMKSLGISDKKDSGKLVGAVIKKLKGHADGALVKKIAEELLT